MSPSRWSRPLIGITAYVECARWGVWEVPATLLPYAYVDKVTYAGGRAIVLPPLVGPDERLVAALDGLILAGGADIDPARYGADPEPATTGLQPDRDDAELGLLERALARDLPVLGICRGMQLLTVASGGTLYQHLPDVVHHDRHRPAPGRYGDHPVRTVPGSRLAEILGEEVIVCSYHHQGVASAGSLRVAGHADDGTIEAVEAAEARFAVGVLWHPEVGEDPRLFHALVTAASYQH